jgi:hypothetical protein
MSEPSLYIFLDAAGHMTTRVSSPEMDAITEVWQKHAPKTVRKSATVCSECGEAWPCTAYTAAEDAAFDLPEGGEFR